MAKEFKTKEFKIGDEVIALKEIAAYDFEDEGLYVGGQYTVEDIHEEVRENIRLQFITIQTTNKKIPGLIADFFEKAPTYLTCLK